MSDYFFYDLNKKMADLANKQQLAEDAQATPAKPAPNKLMEAAADYSAKKAAAGKDIGKPGKNFSKIAAGAAKRYGSEEAGKRVAGAVLNKLRHTEESIDQAQLKPYKSTMKEGGKPDFLDLDKDGNRKEPMKSAARSAKKDMDESALQAAFGKKKYGDQGMKALQKAGRDHASDSTMKKIRNQYDKYDESMMDEVDATPQHVDEPLTRPVKKEPTPYEKLKSKVIKPVSNAIKSVVAPSAPGEMDGATAPPAKGPDGRYPIVTSGPNKGKRWSPATPGPTNPAMKEGGIPMTPKQQKFAKLAPPMDKITFADKIVGAKKEVDEMLGDVAADAMKNAVGKMRGRNRDMEEGFMDDEPTSRRSSTGGRIDTSEPGVTRHRAVKGNYSGAGHDAGADDEPSGQIGRRKVGAGMGKKIGAKINRGTSKLMTKKGDITDEDMFEPRDSGEYDQEGDMAKDTIKTVVRHAQALEKILGDDDNLPEWVQSKLAKIENMMTAVDDYMQNQNDDDMPMEEERTNKRDNRAEKAGRKVAKDIEYDEKKKDGIHGRRRGSEDSKAERAGKKVTKDIEYDEKKDKKKEVDETTSSGSVATGSAAPKSGGGHNYGKGIYDSLNRQLENMISEGMNINMSMNNDDHGGPKKSLTVTATDEDAVMLSSLLKMAGLGNDDDHMHDMTDNDSQMLAIQTMGDEDACSSCGSSPCGCDSEEMYEGLYDSGAKAAFKLAPEAEAALAKYGPEVLQKIKDLIQSTGGPKITKLPYMGPPKKVDDFAAQVLKSPYEPGIAKPTNRIPTIDKAPQMGKSNDTPVFDKSTRQSGMARDPFDPLVDEDRWGAEPPKLPNDMSVTADGGVDVKKSGSDWVYKSKEPGGRVTVTIPAKAANKMLPNTEMDEAYGDTDASENDPDYPTDEVGTADEGMYSGGLDGPKSTGQTTIPVIAGQDDRMGYNGDHELRRMMEIAGLR